MKYEIYKITAPHGYFYIGQHKCETNESEIGIYYFGSSKILQERIYPKYGWPSYDDPLPDVYKFEHLCFANTREEIDALEIKYIEEARKINKDLCLNIANGGEVPPNHTDYYWINNGKEERRIYHTNPLPEGFQYGRINFNYDPDWNWWTDGVNETKCAECPDGWYAGRAPRGEFYNNPITKEIKMFMPGDKIPEGFIPGMGKQTKGPMSKCCWWAKKWMTEAGITNPTDDDIWNNAPDMVYNYFGETDEIAKPKFIEYYKQYINR